MSYTLDNTVAQIAMMSEDYATVQSATENVKALAATIATIDKNVKLKKGQKAALLFSQIRGTRVTMDDSSEATVADMAAKLNIEEGTFSTLRQGGSLMAYCQNGSVKGEAPFNSLTKDKCEKYLDAVKTWYSFETGGNPAAPNIENVLAGALSPVGSVSMANVQILREVFGSVSKLYTVMHGKLHADDPANEQPGDDNDAGDDLSPEQAEAKFAAMAATLVQFGNKHDIAQNRMEFVFRSLLAGNED